MEASRLKVTKVILTKILLITLTETWVWEKSIQPSDSNFEFAGGVANWCGLGYELSVENITTDVVWIHSNWLIADDIHHYEHRTLSVTDREIVQGI